MSAYSLMGLGIALLCVFLAVLHFSFWRASPLDRLHLHLAMGTLGLGLLNLSLAGSSGRAAGTLGWSVPYIALSGFSVWFGWIGTLFMIWTLAGRPLGPGRKVLLALIAAGAAGTTLKASFFVVQHLDTSVSPPWEEMARVGLQFPPFAGFLLSLIGLYEGVVALRARRWETAFLLLSPAVPAALIMGLEVYNVREETGRPALMGLIGLPYILICSVVMAFRYARALRTQEYAGEYKLLRRLGGGGMGELFLATRKGVGGFERTVALKRVIEQAGADEHAIDKLLGEARMAARLSHPNIVAVQDVGRLQDGPEGKGFGWFIAMEYLPGVNLAQVRNAALANGTLLPVEFIAGVAVQVCRGLAHAHAAGIVHRDISPHNVMVTFDGAVKIVDFGVALHPENTALEPMHGYMMGKIGYAAPEQVRGKEVGPQADLFSLGVTLYELLTGVRPFRGETMIMTTDAVLKGEYAPMRVIRPELSERLVATVDRALAKQPGDRYSTAGEMGVALAEAAAALPPVDPGAFVRVLCAEEWAATGTVIADLSLGRQGSPPGPVAATDPPGAEPEYAPTRRL